MYKTYCIALIWALSCAVTWASDDLTDPAAEHEPPAEASGSVDIPMEALPLIEVEASPVEALVGDPIQFRLALIHPPGTHIEALYQRANWGGLEILESSPGKFETLPDGRVHRELHLWIAAYSTGEFAIPSLPILIVVEGVEAELRTPPIAIHIRSLLPEELEEAVLRDIKPQERLFSGNRAVYLLAALAALAIAAAAGFLLCQRQRQTDETERAPLVPAHIRALEALHALRQERELFEQRNVEAFSIRVSEIIRVYIEEKFAMPALDYTSSEILSTLEVVLEEKNLSSETMRELHTFFDECDLIKFARHELAEEGMLNLIDIVEDWVKQTASLDRQTDERPAAAAPSEAQNAEQDAQRSLTT